MAEKLLSTMDLPGSASTMFESHSLHSAEDVLCMTEFDLMEVLDVPLSELSPALERIEECVCPPCSSILSLWEERQATEGDGGYLPTGLKELDEALDGGVPFGLITELVGISGVGKSNLCIMISVLAAMPIEAGGRDGRVIYIDTERKFSSGRMIEIAQTQFPEMSANTEIMQQLAEHFLLLQPSSLSDLMKSVQQLESMVIEHSACLVVIDSVAALLQSDSEGDSLEQKQEMLGKQASLLKILSESFRIPVVVTNQVRTTITDEGSQELPSTPLVHDATDFGNDEVSPEELMEEGLTAALGTSWAHSVNIRLLLEFSTSGGRHIKIVKSPMSALATVAYNVSSKGLELELELQAEQQQGLIAST